LADILITVGPLSRDVAQGALDNGMDEKKIFQFDDSRKAGKFLEGILKEGDVVLAKGSQNTIFMERLVEEIMLHPEDKEKLLVRQEVEWKTR
jgi:UDP-N-acetylmuramoyl-tripeptide--D-alanyl-D-alanine ligase